MSPTLLVVAKAPVPGLAKTRIGRVRGDDTAAAVAAACLLDTLETATRVGWPVVVAMTGDLTHAACGAEIESALAPTHVIGQHGDGLGERLARAHVDADQGHGVVQIGMDTPQVTVEDLRDAGRVVEDGDAALGPAADGGWWLLGVRRGADAGRLPEVVMSRDDTAAATQEVLPGPVRRLRVLHDIDHWEDAVMIAEQLPHSRLATAVGRVS